MGTSEKKKIKITQHNAATGGFSTVHYGIIILE